VGINDVGLMTAPDGHTYAVAVMVRQTSQPPSARHRLMAGVARAVESYWARSGPAGQPQMQTAANPAAVVSGL
jgi:beta-lactamase class A